MAAARKRTPATAAIVAGNQIRQMEIQLLRDLLMTNENWAVK